jgi:membrane fusion protein (multidrug efflux system)
VTALNVDAGTRVAVGDVLLTLDPELAELQWQSARAEVEQASTALTDADRRLQEARTLAPQQSIAKTAVHDLASEVAGDQAALRRAEALAGYRRGILQRHQLRAPFAGVISKKRTELGEWVTPGEPVLELVATERVLLDFPVSEDYLAQLGLQTPVTVTLSAFRDRRFDGEVVAVVPVADENARTVLLRVRVLEGSEYMVPGMSARADLALVADRLGLAVPRDAIIRFPDGRAVVWVTGSGADGTVVQEQRVHTGLSFDGRVEIVSGLEEGASVVVKGNEALKSGQAVVIRAAGSD